MLTFISSPSWTYLDCARHKLLAQGFLTKKASPKMARLLVAIAPPLGLEPRTL